jgi:hypothetical protein
MKPSRKAFKCIGCKKDTWNEYYMLYSRVWKKANPKFKGMLCISCVEARLGRSLAKKDFTKALINTMPMTRTSKLSDRLGRRE